MTLVQRNGAAKGMQASSWLQQSVQQFFQDVNWEGRVLAPPPVENDIDEMAALFPADAPTVSSSLSFTMTVSNYFAAIPWDGVPMIGAPILTDTPIEAAAPEEKSVTLDDFFSSF